jgi:hypothetical protein
MHRFELAGVSDSPPTPLIRYTDSCDGQVEWTQTASDSDRLGTLKNGTPTEEGGSDDVSVPTSQVLSNHAHHK